MNNRVGLGVFGTFGEPYGYQQVFYNGVDFSESLDLADNEIEFYPGGVLYAVKRELVDNAYTVCFCMYSYVRELNTERFGTFLGTSIVLQDGYADADYIFAALKSLHEGVMENTANVENSILIAHQAADVVVKEPQELVALRATLIPVSKTPFFSSAVNPNKHHFVTPNPLSEDTREVQVTHFFDKALKNYTDTSILYFSFDRNVYDFVCKANKLDTKDWDEFMEYKSAVPEAAVVRTKKGIHKMPPGFVTQDKEETTAVPDIPRDDYKYSGSSHPAYDENDDEDDPYKPFDLWEQSVPPRGWSQEEANYRVKEYNRLFRYTNTLLEHINEPGGTREERKEQKKKKREEQQEIEEILTENYDGPKPRRRKRPPFWMVLLGILLLGGGGIFVMSLLQKGEDPGNIATAPPKTEEVTPASVQDPALNSSGSTNTAAVADSAASQQGGNTATAAGPPEAAPAQAIPKVPVRVPAPVAKAEPVAAQAEPAPKNPLMPREQPISLKAKELHPRPNMEMSQNDIAILKEMGVKNKTLAELTRLLFDNVPSNIGNIYRGQEQDYAIALYNANRQVFQLSGSDYICTSDLQALHIPAYKSPRLPAVYPK